MRLFALLVVVVACGGSPKKAPPPPAPEDPIPKTAGPDCAVVADKLAIVVHADKPDAQAMAKGNIKARCTDDKWSDEARSCFATVESEAEIEGCRAHLSDPQKAGLAKHVPPSEAGGGAAPAPAAAAAAPEPAKPKAKAKRSTRGAQPKDSSDPQEGGE